MTDLTASGIGVLMTGLLIDEKERMVLVLLSEKSVGVSVSRYDTLPETGQFQKELSKNRWILVFRSKGEEVFVSQSDSAQEIYVLRTPQERESVQFAVEVAMGAWPEWCPHLRGVVMPRSTIVLHNEMPQA
jgi:hypothetical protein